MTREEALKHFKRMAKSEPPPCKFCGRVMLAGPCCQQALSNSQQNIETPVSTTDNIVHLRKKFLLDNALASCGLKVDDEKTTEYPRYVTCKRCWRVLGYIDIPDFVVRYCVLLGSKKFATATGKE